MSILLTFMKMLSGLGMNPGIIVLHLSILNSCMGMRAS